jgi:hypothetical protein
MAQEKYICVSLMLRKEDIKEFLFSQDYCVWGTKRDLTSFLNDSKKNQQAIIDKSLTVMKKGSEFMLKRNKELLERKDRYLCISVAITDTDQLARMKYVSDYRIYGTKEDCLAMIKKLKNPAQSLININAHGIAIPFNVLSVMPEADLIGKSQVSKEWKSIVDKMIEPRVEALKHDPFRYQKLLYNNSVLTMLRLYKKGYLNYWNYLYEGYIDHISIEFITWVMRAAIKYDVVSIEHLGEYVSYLAGSLIMLGGQGDKIAKLRKLAKPVVMKYLWLLRWDKREKDKMRFLNNKANLKNPGKELKHADLDDYNRTSLFEILPVRVALGEEEWNKVPRIGRLTRFEEDKGKRIDLEDVIPNNYRKVEEYAQRCLTHGIMTLKAATRDAISQAEKITEKVVKILADKDSNGKVNSDHYKMLNDLIFKMLPYYYKIGRVICALDTKKERQRAFHSIYRFVNLTRAYVRDTHSPFHSIYISGGIEKTSFKALEVICADLSKEEIGDFDPGNFKEIVELVDKASFHKTAELAYLPKEVDDLSEYIFARFDLNHKRGTMEHVDDLFSRKLGSAVPDKVAFPIPDIIRDFNISGPVKLILLNKPVSNYAYVMQVIRSYYFKDDNSNDDAILEILCDAGIREMKTTPEIGFMIYKTIKVLRDGDEWYNLDFFEYTPNEWTELLIGLKDEI